MKENVNKLNESKYLIGFIVTLTAYVSGTMLIANHRDYHRLIGSLGDPDRLSVNLEVRS